MKYFVLMSLLILSMALAAQPPLIIRSKPAPVISGEIFNKPDEVPMFPGGPEAMQKYLEDHISRPVVMREICSARKLVAAFVVEKDGSLTQIDIIKSIDGCPDFDFEVLRVIKNMPKWNPGKVNGRWVRCYYKMPVYID